METTLVASDFAKAIGAGRREIETLMLRRDQIGLRTEYAETVSGKERQFTRANVLELACVIAFRKAGLKPVSAAAYAAQVLRAASGSAPVREWYLICGKVGSAANSIEGLKAEKILQGSDHVGSIVRVGAVVRQVDALFDGSQK